jgi:carbon storage regulator
MLVLTRKKDETIQIGDSVVVKVISFGRGKVKIGVEAPAAIRVLRGELAETMANSANHVSETNRVIQTTVKS